MRQAERYDFGHPVYCAEQNNFKFPRGDWRYCDNGVSILEEARPCPSCKQYRTADSHDPCIADLPGVSTACCGHGIQDITPYLTLNPGGVRLADNAALAWFRSHGKGPWKSRLMPPS